MITKQIFAIRDVKENAIIGATNSEENAIKMMKEHLIAEVGLSPRYWLDKVDYIVTKIDKKDLDSNCRYNPFENANTHYVIVEAEDPDEEYEFEIIPIVYQEVK